jgi:hypothetical protein
VLGLGNSLYEDHFNTVSIVWQEYFIVELKEPWNDFLVG